MLKHVVEIVIPIMVRYWRCQPYESFCSRSQSMEGADFGDENLPKGCGELPKSEIHG